MRKLSARWVPHLLTPNNKRNHETTSEQCLMLYKHNPNEFLCRFMTIDDTWIHWYRPETKEQSKQWTSPSECAPKKVKTVLSARKVMATVLWDSQSVMYIDYLEKGKTVMGSTMLNYWADLTPNCRKKCPFGKEKSAVPP